MFTKRLSKEFFELCYFFIDLVVEILDDLLSLESFDQELLEPHGPFVLRFLEMISPSQVLFEIGHRPNPFSFENNPKNFFRGLTKFEVVDNFSKLFVELID